MNRISQKSYKDAFKFEYVMCLYTLMFYILNDTEKVVLY